MEYALGIDLGTTNSCMAIIKDSRPFVIPTSGGSTTMPSIVWVDEQGEILVGHHAKRRFITSPENTIYGSKRLMGRRFGTPEMEELKRRFFYEIIPGETAEPLVRVGKKEFRLEEVGALILSQLRDLAQDHLETRIRKAVISVPAYFSQPQREAVRRAGELADLEVLRIINEPTAAALAYGFNRKANQRILIFDLGGGTFDVTILKMHEEVYEVIGTGGDSFLGGIDFDNRLVDRFCDAFVESTGIDLRSSRIALQRLRDAAERAKIDLSTVEETDVHLPYIAEKGGKTLDFRYRLTRKEFSALTEDLVVRALTITEKTLEEARLTKADVDEIIFVGGMTRCPLVYDMAIRYFGRKPRKDVHPDEVVAQGAALLAHALLSGKESVTLVDVLPVSIGIEIKGGEFRRLIPKNSTLPLTRGFRFRTAQDHQSSLRLRLYQGESREVRNNVYLGELTIEGLPPRPRGEVEVEVEFQLTADSRMSVSAREPQSGKVMKAEFLTQGTIQRERYRADQLLGENPSPPSLQGSPPPQAIPSLQEKSEVTPPPSSQKPKPLPWWKRIFRRG